MIKIIKQIWRGCHTLPSVGYHPGTLVVAILIPVGVIAGGFGGGLIMAACTLPVYLWGAYSRAEFSDKYNK